MQLVIKIHRIINVQVLINVKKVEMKSKKIKIFTKDAKIKILKNMQKIKNFKKYAKN